MITIKETTASSDGSCNFCNDNIGPYGTIDSEQAIYKIEGGSISIRFCRECLLKILKEIKPLLKVQKPDKSIKQYINDCEELQAKINVWAHEIFTGRAQINKKVEKQLKSEVRAILSRGKLLAPLALSSEAFCTYLVFFENMLKNWVSPRRSISPAPRVKIPKSTSKRINKSFADMTFDEVCEFETKCGPGTLVIRKP